jgi:nucleotide-binding universal stress UspA family protein
MMAKRILVPLDARERSEAVLPLVADLARGAGSTVRLLHVAPLARTRISDAGRVLVYAHQLEERRESEGLDRLRDLEHLLDGVAVERRVRLGDTVTEILREAEAFEADLIALSASRRPWWRRAVTRVTSRVRAKSRVPVLTLVEGSAR